MELQDLGPRNNQLDGPANDVGHVDIKSKSIYRGVADRFSYVVSNEGSQARDHLANERTFLAYIRTAVNFGLVGVSVIQLFKHSSAQCFKTEEQKQRDSVLFHAFAKPVGILLTVGALLTVIFGGVRYASTMYYLSRDKFPVSRFSMGIIMQIVVSGEWKFQDMTDLTNQATLQNRQNYSSEDVERNGITQMQSRTNSDIRNRDELRLGRTPSSQQIQQLSDNAPGPGAGCMGKIRTPRHWWNYGSLLLENKGSVARDHLASERTFLAWLRTSLGLASIGVGVTQLLKLSSSSDSDESHTVRQLNKSIGLLFIVGAIVTLLIGTQRYFNVQDSLTRDVFPASKFGVAFLLIFVFSLISIMLGVVFVAA